MRKNKNTLPAEQIPEIATTIEVVETETTSKVVDDFNTEDNSVDDSTLNIAAELLHYPLERDIIQEPIISTEEKSNSLLSFVILGITPNTGKTAVEINNVVYETNISDLKGLIRHIETHIHKAGF
jgi:hypothetical protein